MSEPKPIEMKAIPAAACRRPRSPAKAATSGAKSAGIRKVAPINRRVHISSLVSADIGYPKISATEAGRIMRAAAPKKERVAAMRKMRAARRTNTG